MLGSFGLRDTCDGKQGVTRRLSLQLRSCSNPDGAFESIPMYWLVIVWVLDYLCNLRRAASRRRLSRSSHPRVPRFSSGNRRPNQRLTWSFFSCVSALKSDSTGNTPPRPAPRLSAGCTASGCLPGTPPRPRRRSPCPGPRSSDRIDSRSPGELPAKSTSRRRSPVAWPYSPHYDDMI